MSNKNVAFISLGSNMGDRLQFLKLAVKALQNDVNITIVNCSSIYETIPIGYVQQEQFLNMVVEIATAYTPLELLCFTQSIEKSAGRTTAVRWGPRTIDLDILLYNQENIELTQLLIPHPRMLERGFVLIPLKEIVPTLYFSSVGKSIEDLADALVDKEDVCLWMPLSGEKNWSNFVRR